MLPGSRYVAPDPREALDKLLRKRRARSILGWVMLSIPLSVFVFAFFSLVGWAGLVALLIVLSLAGLVVGGICLVVQ